MATYRVSWVRKDQNKTTGGDGWVKESIQNYVKQSDGRVMNEVVGLESINVVPLKDKCSEDAFM